MIIGRIYQMSLSFVVSMLTARYLGPSNYGLINYASSFTSFFSTFCVLGINSVIVKNGLAKGDIVITAGTQQLQEGTAVHK